MNGDRRPVKQRRVAPSRPEQASDEEKAVTGGSRA